MDLTISLTGATPDAIPALEAMAALLKEYDAKVEFLFLGQWPAGSDAPEQILGYPFVVAAASSSGYGDQLRAALAHARGRWLITLDYPSVDDASLVFGFWHRRDEADLLIASRYAPGGSYRMPFARRIVSRWLNRMYRFGLSVDVRDLSSARRMYRTDVLRRVTLEGRDYDVLME